MKALTKEQSSELAGFQMELEEATERYNTARAELEEFRESICDEMSTYFDERSEKWVDSEKGEAFQRWWGHWQTPTETEELEPYVHVDVEDLLPEAMEEMDDD